MIRQTAADLEEEIKMLQEARKNNSGLAFGGVGGDGGYGDGEDLTVLDTVQDDDDETEPAPRKAPNVSVTGVDHRVFFNEIPEAEEDISREILKNPKRISEREDEYRKRWRNRQLSPEKEDPFAKVLAMQKQQRVSGPARVNAPQAQSGATGDQRSYREIMIEHNLLREEAKVKEEILKKKREEEDLKAREERKKEYEAEKKREEEEEEAKKRRKKEKKKGKKHHSDSSSSDSEGDSHKKKHRSENGEKEEKEEKEEKKDHWSLIVSKEGQSVAEYVMSPSEEITLGKIPESTIQLLHASCSSKHAKIAFKPVGNVQIPHLVDMRSTNGTFLNGKRLEPSVYTPLHNKDVIRFALSTRDYIVMMVPK
eukprot:TRINITY_DN1921_c0_g1_i1.p1 TRINITY_DN1921_c0_g1~~TRINITY_DN1921_c0_g1_i1.p1  ORF type:complete len:367 (-),score=105.13 TRINITY_DN1921_c0_g1_i1:13-1113(-)